MSTVQLNVRPIISERSTPPAAPTRSARLHDAVANHSELAAVALVKATAYGSVLAGTALALRVLRRR